MREIIMMPSVLIPAVVGLIAGLFSGLFGRLVEEWWFRPKLVVEFIEGEKGFRTEGKWTANDVEYIEIYIRARMRNTGRRTAKQCRAYLVRLEEILNNGRVRPAEDYVDSLVLRWPGPDDFAPRDIPPGINQFFDIVGILKNERGWRFGFRERFTSHEELRNYAGTYRFTVCVTGDGATPAQQTIDITYNGNWKQLRATLPP